MTLALAVLPRVAPLAFPSVTANVRPAPEGVAANVGTFTTNDAAPAGMVMVIGLASKSVPAIAGETPVPAGVTVTVTGFEDA